MGRLLFSALLEAEREHRGIRLSALEVAELVDLLPDVTNLAESEQCTNTCPTCEGAARHRGNFDPRWEASEPCATCLGRGRVKPGTICDDRERKRFDLQRRGNL